MDHAAIQALDQKLRSITVGERKSLVDFLRHLDVFDRAKAYAALNCGSTFEYLVRKHHLPEGTAWRRVNAMRLIRTYPAIEGALEDGRLNTSNSASCRSSSTPRTSRTSSAGRHTSPSPRRRCSP